MSTGTTGACQHSTFWVNTNAAAAAAPMMGQTWVGTIPPPSFAPCTHCQIAALETRIAALEKQLETK